MNTQPNISRLTVQIERLSGFQRDLIFQVCEIFEVCERIGSMGLRSLCIEANLLRIMKSATLIQLSVLMAIAIFMTPFSSFAQTVDPARLKINGIVGLDSTYGQVVKLLGKPRKETKPRKEECTGGHEKTVDYDGLSFYFMDGPSRGGRTYLVMSFDVTSPKIAVSGVRLGDNESIVRRRYGKPSSVDTDESSGETVWHYEIGEKQGPGQTTVTFKNGKVTAIGSSYSVC